VLGCRRRRHAADNPFVRPIVTAPPRLFPPSMMRVMDSDRSVQMPALGGVTEGTVTRWLKQEGDPVEVDEPLLEVSTDKVDTEIPSPVAGVLSRIIAQEDDTVEIGGELAVIGDAGEASAFDSAPAPAAEEPAVKQTPAVKQQAPAAEAPATEPAPEEPTARADNTYREAPYVTPLVRKVAKDNDVDLSTIKGTGTGGRIRKQDVLAAAEARKSREPGPELAATATEINQIVAATLESLQATPATSMNQKYVRNLLETYIGLFSSLAAALTNLNADYPDLADWLSGSTMPSHDQLLVITRTLSVAVEFARIWNITLFENWLVSPNAHLNFSNPSSLIELGETDAVMSAIESAAWGVYA
jgi:hypothetical protein